MSPSRRSRAPFSALTISLIGLAFVTVVSVGARRQLAGARSLFTPVRHAFNSPVLPDKRVTPQGNTITVNSTSDVANSADGLCTLREAIRAANNNAASGVVAGECGAGGSSGADTVDLSGVSGTITLNTSLDAIQSGVTINGPGANLLTVQRSSAGGTPNFAVFAVTLQNLQTYTFSGLTLSNGNNPAGGNGGGI